MRTQTKNLTKGFTIIEVLIVLAVAGLIMAIIFLAVPALQRNSRNNSRTNDAAHLAGLVNDYAANHAGNLPTTVGAGANDLILSGENWAIVNAPTTANMVATNTFGTTTALNVNRGFTCNAATNSLTGASNRSFAITFQVETSGAAQNRCIQG